MVLFGVFPVLPLKVLVARKVIREGMDCESYLGGRVKEELDGLAGLAGRYVVEDAKLEVFHFKLVTPQSIIDLTEKLLLS